MAPGVTQRLQRILILCHHLGDPLEASKKTGWCQREINQNVIVRAGRVLKTKYYWLLSSA